MAHAFSLGIFLYALWFLLSGYLEPLLLVLGLVSVGIVVVIALRMEVIDHESYPVGLLTRLPLYLPWLFWQIIKSNLSVAKLILNPKLPISPTVVEVRASQSTSTGRVTYANSITLTPGTVSVGLEDDRITVHALTEEFAGDLQTGEMDQMVARLEDPS